MSRITVLSEDRVFSALVSRNLQMRGHQVAVWEIHPGSLEILGPVKTAEVAEAVDLVILDLHWYDPSRQESYQRLVDVATKLRKPMLLLVDGTWTADLVASFHAVATLRKPFSIDRVIEAVELHTRSEKGTKKAFSRVLVPLDGSSMAEGVLPYVRLLSRRVSAQVELLQVIEPNGIQSAGSWVPEKEGVPTSGRGAQSGATATDVGIAREAFAGDARSLADARPRSNLDQVQTRLMVQASQYLKEIAATIAAPNVQVREQVVIGQVVPSILAEADREQDTLVAMSTHGRSGLGRWLLGSVTTTVVNESNHPLLVVRPSHTAVVTQGEARLSSMIVPVDGSRFSEQKMSQVEEISHALGLRVDLVLVNSQSNGTSSLDEELDTKVKKSLDRIQKRLEARGITSIKPHLLQGSVVDQILKIAHETPDSLIALSTRGRSNSGRWILGSVTDQVIHASDRPVLLVRPARRYGRPDAHR